MLLLNVFLAVLLSALPVASSAWVVRWPKGRSSSSTALLQSSTTDEKPILVLGATGRVGRLVVQQLMGQDKPVRALVRNRKKACSIFGTGFTMEYPKLQVHVVDMGYYDHHTSELDQAVEGCSAIISVMGVVRFSKLTDFLPWRIFQQDVSSWADRDHPYYGNYLAQKYLIQLAEKHEIQRFVRLTGLGLSTSAFNPFTVLFNTLLSINNRWGILCEQALAKSKIPYVILRPGGLLKGTRNMTSTHLQVDLSGKLPFPGRCGRADVAALSIAALLVPPEKSLTLACRWCGDGVEPRPQGSKKDGFATAEECICQLSGTATRAPAPKMKPYGVAVSIFVYTLALVGCRILLGLWHLAMKLFWG